MKPTKRPMSPVPSKAESQADENDRILQEERDRLNARQREEMIHYALTHFNELEARLGNVSYQIPDIRFKVRLAGALALLAILMSATVATLTVLHIL
jgi:hypothetical protein